MNRKNIENYTSYKVLKLLEDLNSEQIQEFEISLSLNMFKNFGIKSFIDLAQIFFLKVVNISIENESIIIEFKKLNEQSSFHKEKDLDDKYGVGSKFFDIDKTKEFSFLFYYQEALKFVDIYKKESILNIGVNKGDEFSVIKELLSGDDFKSKKLLGIDYSKSAIEYAKEYFNEIKNIKFLCADVNKLYSLDLGRFDLIISIGTLQSSNINFNAKFMELYQNHLNKGGAIILGFPNCRWIDGEMVYGAKAPNYSFNEMSLVLKDIHFCKKYLQQKGYRVVITGKDYLFLSARKIAKS